MAFLPGMYTVMEILLTLISFGWSNLTTPEHCLLPVEVVNQNRRSVIKGSDFFRLQQVMEILIIKC